MIEIGIIGAKNAGKTTLVEKLTKKAVADGFSISTVKHTNHTHTFDTPGKDSFRHRAAGALATVAFSKKELALFIDNDSDKVGFVMEKFLTLFDICLIEGEKKSKRKNILLTNNYEDIKNQETGNLIATYGDESLGLKVDHFTRDETDKLYSYLKENIFSQIEVAHD